MCLKYVETEKKEDISFLDAQIHRLSELKKDLNAREFKGRLFSDPTINIQTAKLMFWMNSSSRAATGRFSAKKAEDHVQTYGATHWWTLEDIEDFVQCPLQSKIFLQGMWDLGFFRKGNRWLHKENSQGFPAYLDDEQKTIPFLSPDEAQRVKSELTVTQYKEPHTVSLLAMSGGQLVLCLDETPSGCFYSRRMKVHFINDCNYAIIDCKQSGLSFTAHNVPGGYIYMTGEKENIPFAALWPEKVPNLSVVADLFNGL